MLLNTFEGFHQRLEVEVGGGHFLPLPRALPSSLGGHCWGSENLSWRFPAATRARYVCTPSCLPAQVEPVGGGTRSFTVTLTFVQRPGANHPPKWKVVHCIVFPSSTPTQARGPIPVLALGTNMCTRTGHRDQGLGCHLLLWEKQLLSARILASSEGHSEMCPPGAYLQQC